MEDSAVVRKIRAELERNTDVNLHESHIEITSEDMVTLHGEAEDIAVKRRAMQIARNAAPDRTVVDALVIRVEQPRTGDELRQSVLNALVQEPTFSGFAIRGRGEGAATPPEQDWIEAEVEGSRVRLYGRVWSLSHRRLAEVLAWWTPGTADVENRIHVEPAERDNDEEISDAVRLVFDMDPSLDAQQISIKTENAEVHLQGVVRSDICRKMAGLDCWYIPGVHAVHNDLQVRQGAPGQH